MSTIQAMPQTFDEFLLSLSAHAVPKPFEWSDVNASTPSMEVSVIDVFKALVKNPHRRFSGVAHDDDPAIAHVHRNVGDDGVARAFAFVIDKVRITLIEDGGDGYRSTASTVQLDWQGPVRNTFLPVEVNVEWSVGANMVLPQGKPDDHAEARHKEIRLVCPFTNATILNVGTEYGDVYYPSMVTSFHPEGMVETARRAEIEHLHQVARDVAPNAAPGRRRRL